MTSNPPTTHTQETAAAIKELVAQWGWTTPTPEVEKQAQLSLRWSFKSALEIVVGLNIVPLPTATKILESKPGNASALEWLAQKHDNVRSRAGELEAVHLGVQWISLPNPHFVPHPLMGENVDVARELKQYRAALLLCQGSKPVLAFADALDLRAFRQLTGAQREQSALAQTVTNLPLALGSRDGISRLLSNTVTEENADGEQGVKRIYSSTLREDDDLKLLDEVHQMVLSEGGTDIHITVRTDSTVYVAQRINRDMEELPIEVSLEAYMRWMKYLLRNSDAQRNSSMMVDPADGRYLYVARDGSVVTVRANFIPSQHIIVEGAPAISARMRLQLMNEGEIDLAQKGVRADVVAEIESTIAQGQGLMLLVGPTNSGKSVTIAGTIAAHRRMYGDRKSRVSAEDPIERPLPGVHQFEIPNHRRGKDGFAVLSKNFMRHDGDLIFLGEIRDTETAEYAVQFADTGHLVVSTLHAKTASTALQRLLNMLPTDKPLLRQAALESTNLIISQRLVQKICPHCGPMEPPTEQEIKDITHILSLRGSKAVIPPMVRHRHAQGCDHPKCREGVCGVLPVNELIVLTDDIRVELLTTILPLAQAARKAVKIHYEDMAMEYVEQGLVGLEALTA